MKIQNIKIENLKKYDNNPRKITEQAINAVAESIKEFGFKIPIVIDANNIIIAGHTRLAAAQELGLTEIPCVIADDLNEEQVKAFRLADNKVASLSLWDFKKLDEELDGIINLDMSNFGFDEVANLDKLDDFFAPAANNSDADKTHTQEEGKIKCPHCGKFFEL
ncbi:MAG: ParB N-terminal domain-containing protein [Synergistaceae bacterium]|nr:ParB N-terminal domain-containing protein [Synergistaceae bacterium]